jgi:cardiolipin synthase
LHQKIVVVDEIWSHIGSTNFDSRSLALNEEVGIGILDSTVAAELKHAFNEDLKRCKEITLSAWQQRAWHTRAFDWVAYQVHDQL